jgi:hypothetical protein
VMCAGEGTTTGIAPCSCSGATAPATIDPASM